MTISFGIDIGSNSVGSTWIDRGTRQVVTGVSVFPAGVEESDEKRGDPKNAKRRMTRRTRITLARRAERKRELRLKLISAGLLPPDEDGFRRLLEQTDPWTLRRKGLDEPLSAHEFGRVLLHLAQRRGALGLKVADPEDPTGAGDEGEDGKVKAAIGAVRAQMHEKNARTFGELIEMVRAERVTPITTEDRRPEKHRKGPREYRDAVRNKAGSYEHCADRVMIRDEFAKLWDAQKRFNGPLAEILSELRKALDDESGDSIWRHKGLLFGQRRTYWDAGTLGRCVLEPSERCVPQADMYASHYLVVETVNNLKIVERGQEPRALTPEERERIRNYLSGPLGVITRGKQKGQPKRKVTVSDLRELMGWGPATKTAQFHFNIEVDEEKPINADWFSREIVAGAVTVEHWRAMSERVREGINRAILKYDPDDEKDAVELKAGVVKWGGLTEAQADALVAAWRRRPRLDATRLNMSRRAVRNLLVLMDRPEPWRDPNRPRQMRWLTQIEARKLIAEDADFKDVTTGKALDADARRRYATGTKGATARDRHYIRKHLLRENGEPIHGPDGLPLAEPPPAPLISNPVVRKAIHEVRRHLIEYMTTFARKPDEVYVELSREAKMGKKDADALLFRNRLRNRIRNDIIASFGLDTLSSTQQRAAVDRVVLCLQQRHVCPLCGQGGLTDRMAANGEGCEVAHIIPRARGGHNGLGNIVLAHTKCNRDMGRRTPRQFWEEKTTSKGGFEEGIARVEKIYGDIERPRASEVKNVTGNALWLCYFTKRDDARKVEQFKKDIKDIQGMTERQEAATKYAARQVMAYLADALYEGKGLPERGGNRLIYATDGMWTARLRREWGLFFDPHGARAKGLANEQEHERKEKNRGDHRHHAIDAVVTALCSREVQIAWEKREKQADEDGINTADEEAMENYRRLHPLPPPGPFKDREEFREAVRRAVFGDGEVEKPVCHRPVKRKLIGALHEETLFGPVLDKDGNLTDNYTAKKTVLALTPNHLRMPEGWDHLSAKLDDRSVPESSKRQIRAQLASMQDPPPGKSGIVRDRAVRDRIRKCLWSERLDPDKFTPAQIKALCRQDKPGEWKLRHASGIPIRSVVLLRTMSDPVIISRWASDHKTGDRHKLYDANTGQGDATAARAYVGGNNHHIEIRVATDKRGKDTWSGEIITAFSAAQQKLARLRAIRESAIPKPNAFRRLPKVERAKHSEMLRAIDHAHPLVDRNDSDAKGGRFVMSLSEGEMLLMKHKETGDVGYFVIAKLDKPQSIVLVPHWDARAATGRKDAEGKKVDDSKREQFAVTPADLKALAPPGHPHAAKVRVSPLGEVTVLKRD